MNFEETEYHFAEKLNKLICWLINNGYKVRYGDVYRREAYLIIKRNGQDMPDSDWLEIGAKWEELGGKWGGRFGVDPKEAGSKIGWDRGHFEM